MLRLEQLLEDDRAARAQGEARTRRRLTRAEKRRAADEAMAHVNAGIALRALLERGGC